MRFEFFYSIKTQKAVIFIYVLLTCRPSEDQSQWGNGKVLIITTHLTMTPGKVALTSSWEPMLSGNVPEKFIWVYLSYALKCLSTFGVMDVGITLVWVFGK
jgi:hypothetical protein